ncbi:unnamed protein product, partial [Hapterophycus canaliculatus]
RAAIIASIGGLLFGYDIGVVEGALPQLALDMHLSLGQQDAVVSTMVIGALAGSVVAGYLTDRLGRWRAIVLTDLTFITGAAVLFAAQSPAAILLGRFVVGMGVSVSAVADVSYLAEVAPKSLRGSMVSCNELAISIGMLVSFLTGHLLREVQGGWRYMFGLSALLALLQLVLMLAFMPLSPRWLLTRRRREEARHVLLKIRNNEEEVNLEIREIEFIDRDTTGSLKELFTEWGAPLAVTIILSVCQQLIGQSNVLNFTQEILRRSHFRAKAPAVVLGVVKVVSTVIAIIYVDKVGRRPFLLWGAAACTGSIFALALAFLAEEPLLSFVACCALIASYSVSFGPLTWLITAEMFPAGVRGKALGIGQIGSYAGNLVASAFFLRLLHVAGGFVTFFFFGSVAFLSTTFIFAAVPETRGKEPERIASEIPSCRSCLPYDAMPSDGRSGP